MKFKSTLVLLLSVVLMFALAACGGGNSSTSEANSTASAANSSTPAPTSSPEAVEADVAEEDNPYNLDHTSSEWQEMSNDRATNDDLQAAREIIQGDRLSYDKVIELIGCDPSSYYNENGVRNFRWVAAEQDSSHLTVTFKGETANGPWIAVSTTANLD